MILKEDYTKLLANKTVALIGGAPLDDTELERANQADLIVHLNDHWLEHGGRCDIVYMCGGKMLEFVDRDVGGRIYQSMHRYAKFFAGLKYAQIMLWQNCSKSFAERCIRDGVPWAYYGATELQEAAGQMPDTSWPNDWAKLYHTFPFQGSAAAYHLLLHPLKELYVCGFNFYLKEDGTNPLFIGNHYVQPNIMYFADLLKSDPRVKVCAGLQSVVDNKIKEDIERGVVDRLIKRYGIGESNEA